MNEKEAVEGWKTVERGTEGGGGAHLLLTLAVSPLTTHPVRDGAPFLLLKEIIPTFGRSLHRFHKLRGVFLPVLSPSCFAVCAHHLSPRIVSQRIVIVFSLLSKVPNSSMSHPTVSFISSDTSRSSLVHFTFSYHVTYTLRLLRHTGTTVHLLPPPGYWYTSYFWQVPVPHTKSHFQRFGEVH